MKTLYWNAYGKYLNFKNRMEENFDEKEEGMSHSTEVIIVVLVVIAIGALLLTTMPSLFNDILQAAKTKVLGFLNGIS